MSQKVLLNAAEVNIALHRLACQLIENHDTFSETVLIGIQPRGIFLAERIKLLLETSYKVKNIELVENENMLSFTSMVTLCLSYLITHVFSMFSFLK